MKNHIVFGFSTSKDSSLLSSTIRWAEGTKFSHCYIQFYSRSIDRHLIYEASSTGLRFLGRDRFLADNKVIESYAVDVDEGQHTAALRYCVDNAGVSYGWLQLVGMAGVRALGVLGLSVRNPFRDGPYTQVCDEVAANILDLCEFVFDRKIAEDQGPRWFNQLMREFASDGKAIRLS